MSETPNPPNPPSDSNVPSSPEGAATPPAPPAQPETQVPSLTPPEAGSPDPADVEKNKVLAMLSYLGILWLVPLLAAKDSPNPPMQRTGSAGR